MYPYPSIYVIRLGRRVNKRDENKSEIFSWKLSNGFLE